MEQTLILQLLQSPQWSALESIAKRLHDEWNGESVVKDTEWDTLRAALEKEGRVRGLELFMQEIWRVAGKDK